MLSLFAVACSKFGASSLKAEVSATDVNTLISAAPLATAANKHDINPPAAISTMRFANDVWIMHPCRKFESQSGQLPYGGLAHQAGALVIEPPAGDWYCIAWASSRAPKAFFS